MLRMIIKNKLINPKKMINNRLIGKTVNKFKTQYNRTKMKMRNKILINNQEISHKDKSNNKLTNKIQSNMIKFNKQKIFKIIHNKSSLIKCNNNLSKLSKEELKNIQKSF